MVIKSTFDAIQIKSDLARAIGPVNIVLPYFIKSDLKENQYILIYAQSILKQNPD